MTNDQNNSACQSPATQQMRSLASDWLSQCTPHQAGLLRMLAVGHQSDLDTAQLVDAVAHEFPLNLRVLTRRFGVRLKEGQALLPALEEDDRLLPASVVLAIKMAAEAGQLDEFFAAITTHRSGLQSDGKFDSLQQPKGYFSLYLKTIYIFALMTFIVLFIIPQFIDMYEEFGIELPSVTVAIMILSERVSQFAIFPLTLIALWMLWSIRPLSAALRRRWSPTSWATDPVPQPVQNLRTFALAAATRGQETNVIERLPVEHPHKTTQARLARAKKHQGNANGPWQTLAQEKLLTWSQANALSYANSPQVEAWLLRTMADQEAERTRCWQTGRRRAVIGIVNAVLTACVLLFAVGVFAALISIIVSFA